MTSDDLWHRPKARDLLNESPETPTESPQDRKAWIAAFTETDTVAPQIVRPKCPACGTPLECYFGRHAKRYRVIHSRTDCENRWRTFAYGETETDAWKTVTL